MIEKIREKPIPENKIKKVKELVGFFKKSKTSMIVSIKGIPGNQFQEIKKKLRGKAKVKVVKKSLVLRALKEAELEKLNKHVHEDIALLFSELNAFELSAILGENQSTAKARAGQEALDDIVVDAGATDLPPGPAISELSGVGLKVKIEDGKIAVQEKKVVVKKGEKIKEEVANVLGKLDVTPFKVGFIPEIAYDSENEQVYEDIKIDKEETLDCLREFVGKAFNLAARVGYICKETIGFLLRKAAGDEAVLSRLVKEDVEKKEEAKAEEEKEKVEQGKETEKPSEEAGENKKLAKEKEENQTQQNKQEEEK